MKQSDKRLIVIRKIVSTWNFNLMKEQIKAWH